MLIRRKKCVVVSCVSRYVRLHRRHASSPIFFFLLAIKLKLREHKSENLFFRNSYEKLYNMMMVVFTRLDELDKSLKLVRRHGLGMLILFTL
jgi:hypothetical protein